MNRLKTSSVDELGTAVIVPTYDRRSLRVGMVHLGLGAFHRAHQALYTEQAMSLSRSDEWGIIGVSMRSQKVAEQLLPQDGLYSIASEDASDIELQVVGAIIDVLVASEDAAAVTAAIARPDVRVLTLTITEKGYSLGADGRSLDREDEAVKLDLANPRAPTTAIGILALGLRKRAEAGVAPLTVISCDNLSQNSTVLRKVLVDYLMSTFPRLLYWLEKNVTFPCSMADRIVPAISDQKKQRQSELLGLRDEGAVCTEPFSQWIIEDKFAGAHPDWRSAGALYVQSIVPYENIKLGLLNAGHSAIAYCGLLANMETVDEVMQDVELRSFVERLMAEDLIPSLQAPPEFDLASYQRQVLARMDNPALGHRCTQIAMDGSEKISQRWLPSLRGGQSPLLVKALSAWCYFVLCTELVIDDPRADQLGEMRASTLSMKERLIGVLACVRIIEESIGDFAQLCTTLENHLQKIERAGVKVLLSS
jgi:fructuronate reductase